MGDQFFLLFMIVLICGGLLYALDKSGKAEKDAEESRMKLRVVLRKAEQYELEKKVEQMSDDEVANMLAERLRKNNEERSSG